MISRMENVCKCWMISELTDPVDVDQICKMHTLLQVQQLPAISHDGQRAQSPKAFCRE